MPAPKRITGHKKKDGSVPRHEDCWAKTTKENRLGISVRNHCINVGFVAEALIDRTPDWIKAAFKTNHASILAALHDIGKVSPGFQCKCDNWIIELGIRDRALQQGWGACEKDHAKISQFTIQQMLHQSALGKWAAIIGAHHGKCKGLRIASFPEIDQDAWSDERQRLTQELVGLFGNLPDKPAEEAELWFLAGLISVADWLGSNEEFFPLCESWNLQKSRDFSRQSLDAIGWRPPLFKNELFFGALFKNYSPNSLQLAAIQNIRERGLYVIEGPMGMGKTEAALAASYQLIEQGEANGIYFALPTQVTSNRIHFRVREFLERSLEIPAELCLAHSSSWLQNDGRSIHLNPAGNAPELIANAREGSSWFASSKRALLAPFGVGTVDQALLGIVAANHFFVRQFGLAGKVVILDEVHSYDLYTGTLIDVLVKRLLELQCTVIVLSATLTKARRRQILRSSETQSTHAQGLADNYPLLSGIAGKLIEIPCEPPVPKTVTIRFVDGKDMFDECIDRAEQGQCVLWIRNTVDEAQETYRALKASNREGGPEIGLLHARFPFFRREQLEDKWMKVLGKDSEIRPAGCVLVSTQIAEQSVDIDADFLITDLAPTDMLLQRMGRLWRHNRNRPSDWKPEIGIRSLEMSFDRLKQATEKDLRSALGKSAKVYAPYVLLRSLQQLQQRDCIVLPTDIRAILEATYAEPVEDEPAAWRKLYDDVENMKRKLTALAISNANIWGQPSLPDEEGVQTRFSTYQQANLLLVKSVERLNSHAVRLIPLDGKPEEVDDRKWSFDAAKTIYLNLVRVPRWVLSNALVNPSGWLTNHVSQSTAAGLLRPDGKISWLGNDEETDLSYHPDMGVIINRKNVPRNTREKLDESYD
jgi:CRISPR-associated endonuclease/helicase Cas3